ncbi:hypothetical protein PFISCL1PPCAC_23976, partial [Pristionchus fissidentatus]
PMSSHPRFFSSLLHQFLLLLLLISIVPLVIGQLRHTFDTKEMCNARCAGQCASENSGDHMGMPRWVCNTSGHPKNTRYTDDEYPDESEGESSVPSLAILVPVCILASLFFFFVCVSCTQRFLR